MPAPLGHASVGAPVMDPCPAAEPRLRVHVTQGWCSMRVHSSSSGQKLKVYRTSSIHPAYIKYIQAIWRGGGGGVVDTEFHHLKALLPRGTIPN